jgi:hypothetical protein
MKSNVKRFALGALAALLLVSFVAGCHSAPEATPVDKRAPGNDLPGTARKAKQGDE